MPSAGKHLRNAQRHHTAAVVSAADPRTRSWAAVALFYAAHQLVHAVLDGEANLADAIRHPTSHGSGRDGPPGTSSLVSRLYGEIDLHYKSLFAAGKSVRYAGASVPDADFQELLTLDYAAVAAWARLKLEKQGRTFDAAWP